MLGYVSWILINMRKNATPSSIILGTTKRCLRTTRPISSTTFTRGPPNSSLDAQQRASSHTKELQTLVSYEIRTPQFYGLPKVHKPNNPIRPIVSQINGPTYALNKIVDKALVFAESQVPHLVIDTKSFLNKIIKTLLPNGVILVTFDVTSLYTNIEWEEGIRLVVEW